MFKQDISQLRKAVLATPETVWPGGYSETALAVIDSIYSIGAHYTSTQNVVKTYRRLRKNASTDTAEELLQFICDHSDASSLADVFENHQRTSTAKSSILKASAVQQAAAVLVTHGASTRSAVTELAETKSLDETMNAWLKINGQSYGTSWRYFLMLSNIPGVKPDGMILRFCSRALSRRISAAEAPELLEGVAHILNLSATDVDHRIWHFESGRG